MDLPLGEFDHPAWVTAVGTGLGWAVVLAVVTILLFLVPFLLWP